MFPVNDIILFSLAKQNSPRDIILIDKFNLYKSKILLHFNTFFMFHLICFTAQILNITVRILNHVVIYQ